MVPSPVLCQFTQSQSPPLFRIHWRTRPRSLFFSFFFLLVLTHFFTPADQVRPRATVSQRQSMANWLHHHHHHHHQSVRSSSRLTHVIHRRSSSLLLDSILRGAIISHAVGDRRPATVRPRIVPTSENGVFDACGVVWCSVVLYG